MNRYNITPEVTTDEMRVSVSLLIEEHPSGAWVKHEEAAQEIDDLIKQIAALDGELEQAWRERARAERMEAERAEQCEAIKRMQRVDEAIRKKAMAADAKPKKPTYRKYGTKYLDWSELGPKADEMIAEGYALHKIAEILSISRSRLYDYVRRKKDREGVA